ncbi:hypothetical protein AVEN_43506-1 [Araneus ventricosus]|uniref:Uncharacterized protein n=1 Tax=Araneus ventricosus TaxID=182803 RepID=A0A4Y2F331_ARAVE|nr:hypothetical protein AVEN_43506-1 [Araneus ventricosus]
MIVGVYTKAKRIIKGYARGKMVENPYPRAIVPTSLPASKMRSPDPLSRKSLTSPPPFCGFRFCERASIPFYRMTKGKMSDVGLPNFSTTTVQF